MKMELNSKTIKKILLIVFLSAIIVCGVFNMSQVLAFFTMAFSFISPVVLALCIAFVLNIPLNFLENKIFSFMDKSRRKFVKKLKRPLCIVLCYLLALGVITLLVLVIIPDIIDTIIFIADRLPSIIETAREWITSTATRFNIPAEDLPNLNFDFTAFANTVTDWLSGYSGEIVGDAVSITTSVIGGVFDTVLSIVISVYVLAQKERIGNFTKRIIDTFIPQNTCKILYHIAHQTADSFSKFIGGQFTESVILGILCYIGMLIFRFPNAPIISVLITVTSLVPVVGALVGVTIGFFLIVITNPIKALLFVVFIIILQQIEGNLIYPRVVGKAVGLPGIIVISAVLVGGNIGGILGALLGVPVSAVIFILLKETIDNRTPKIEQV